MGDDLTAGLRVTQPMEASTDGSAGEALHIGLRLSDVRVGDVFGRFHPLFSAIDRLLVEYPYHVGMIRRTWTAQHLITLGMGTLALLAGAWDLWVGELASGGDVDHTGISLLDADSGISHVLSSSVFLMLLGLGLFLAFLVLAWQHFPLMRSQAIYLFVAWMAVDVGMIAAHSSAPWFPAGAAISSFGLAMIGNVVLFFILFVMVHRPVSETRDMHVRERHGHPDPRVMLTAERDHSLGAWTSVLLLWALFVNISAWSGAHFVAPRPPFETGRWLWYFVHILSGVGVVALTMHLLWFPQLMLGEAGDAIESRRAREISRGVEPEPEAMRGVCPECGEETEVTRYPDGRTEMPCRGADCSGSGAPHDDCGVCGDELPGRLTCASCGVSAPVGDHFGEEAW